MMTLPRLKSAQYVSEFKLRVVWTDGYAADVDMTGVLARSKTLSVLSPDDFAKVRLVDYGAGMAWPYPGKPFNEDAPDRLDFSSSALREIAQLQQSMSADQFKQWQNRHNLSNAEAANIFDVKRRTIDNYRAGKSPIPSTVHVLCETANNHPEIINALYRPSAPVGRPPKKENVA